MPAPANKYRQSIDQEDLYGMSNVEDQSTPEAARGGVATTDRPERVKRSDPTDKNTLKESGATYAITHADKAPATPV